MKIKIIILMLVLLETSFSQVGINISSSFISDDNLFKNPTRTYSNLNTNGLGFFYNRFDENSQLSFSYDLNLNAYNQYSNANNNTNSGMIGYAISNEDESRLYTVSAAYSSKSLYDEYQLYSEKDFSLTGSFNNEYDENHSGEFRYSFNKVSYENFSDFSYAENILGYTSSFSWQTKTSLFLDLNLGYKIYSNDIYITDEDNTSSSLWVTKGKGYGRLKNMSGNSSSQKLENGNLQTLITTKVAQSLLDNLGTYCSYSLRYNIENNSRSVLISDTYFSDDEIFDDPYGYSGHEFELGLTYISVYNIKLSPAFAYQIKDYANQYPDGDILLNRNDHKYLFKFGLSKSFSLFETVLENLTLHVNYIYQKNESNINPFDYNNNIFGIGINTTVKF